ncbi:type I-B CRISPR-associated protein Cas8b1/Cst1 [Geosporobacter ferrireducens]|nr:type I-B CRISPR-associated protein Cas8b1/Cst1 [Geosporobacter ferrireducens]MTI53561.1 type I-B CRISPR-associated protein Cas8b1/Cst1 [Geosporobacter ferrireducens]
MGLIGFIRILKEAGKIDDNDIKKMKNNYIEFNSELLEDFHKNYFDYFLKRYDISVRECEKIDRYLLIAQKEDKFKNATDWIKGVVDNNRKKIKGKLENKVFEQQFDEIYKNLSKIKKADQIEELKDSVSQFKKLMTVKDVNNKLSINFVRSIFSKQYFGQASFLQKPCAAKSVEEQSEIMFRDYIKPVIGLSELMDQSKDIDALKMNLENELKDSSLSKNYEKMLKTISGLAKTRDSLEAVKKCFYEDMLYCSVWENFRATNDFTEGVFAPLAVSNNNAKNYMWDFCTFYPISDIAKLILLCTPAGTVDMQDEYFGFVNLDTDVYELFRQNENLRLKKEEDNVFESLIYDIVSEAREKSKWMLQNILFIEFKMDIDSKNCKLNYFNIPKNVASYFKKHAQNDLGEIKDKTFKKDLVALMLDNKTIKTITYQYNEKSKGKEQIANNIERLIEVKLRSIISSEKYSAYDALLATIAKHKFNRTKEGCEKVDSKKIWVIYKSGQELNTYFKRNQSENKIQGIAYRLLNASKAGNKKEFLDSLLRIYMTAGKEVPSIFLNVMHEQDLEFETVAHAFVSGLISSENHGVKEDK